MGKSTDQITIWHNPRCKKSRETLKIIEDAGHIPHVRKYLQDPPSERELASVLKQLEIQPKDLIRTNEKVYKEEFKGKEFSDHEWISIMIHNPKLIERPVVTHNGKSIIGRPPENVKTLL